MDTKKGIRIKTKQVSLVDNIVNFFKPVDLKPNPNPQPNQSENDTSPRSITPRKKIFDKTPEKAGKINLSNLNNKSMDHAYQITFNDQPINFKDQQSKSQLSPPKRFTKPKAFDDTQFNKLILGNSQVSIKKTLTPQKTFLNDLPSNDSANSIKQAERQRVNGQFARVQGSFNRQVQKQLDHHKKLLRECVSENEQLKRENQSLREQVQSLRKVIKSYELSSIAHNNVPIVTLESQNITSPLQKVSPFSSQNRNIAGYKTEKSFEQNDKKKHKMKQSIPIMPQIPNEYNQKEKSPKIGQTSFLSSDLKSRSHDGSFLQSEKNCQNFPGFSIPSQHENQRVLSPLQKTIYDKTMKPQQRQRKTNLKEQKQKEQISFSKTVGYIKGDQPMISNKNQQTSKINNPFQQIATQSNKFLFQNSNNLSVSNNSFKVDEKSNKGFNGKEWVVFTQGQSSLGYSSNSNSKGSFNQHFASPANFNKQSKMQPSRYQVLDKSKDSKMRSPKHQHSVTQKMKIQGQKTYKFQDFDPNEEDSSYVDYF